MAGHRLEHLNENLRQKLSTIIIREIQDERIRGVTITSVSLDKNLSYAKVQYACYNPGMDIADVTDALNKAAGYLSRRLGKTLTTRNTPRLQFYYDRGFDYAQEIENLLAKVIPRAESQTIDD